MKDPEKEQHTPTPCYKYSDGVIYPILSIDFVNREFCILPEEELEGGNQVNIVNGFNEINWDYDSLKAELERVKAETRELGAENTEQAMDLQALRKSHKELYNLTNYIREWNDWEPFEYPDKLKELDQALARAEKLLGN